MSERRTRYDGRRGRNPVAVGNGLSRTATWDGRDSDGRLLRAGLYFITLEAGGRRAAVRVISLR